MVLVWTLAGTCLLLASSAATFLTMVHLRYRWDVHASSVRWLFWCFFLHVFLWSLTRAVFFLHVLSLPVAAEFQDRYGIRWSQSQLDKLGIFAVVAIEEYRQWWISLLLSSGDLALCGNALTLFPLTYELWRLARKSMDRGIKKEQQMIRRYWLGIVLGVVLFGGLQAASLLNYGCYDVHALRCVLVVYVVQFVGMVFMAALLSMLKVNGRKYETIHGTFVESPIYQRLKRIMLVYILFSFVFQVSTLILNVVDKIPTDQDLDILGISLLSYNASGLALAVTTSCSQACVFSTCRHCLPEDFEAEYMYQRFVAPKDEDLEAPSVNPVFVFTDIESSTALWNVDSELMAKATEIHDNILRSSLLTHRGYEITTVGDAFQVAFRTIKDAVEYCLDVQLQLLVAKWPKELDGASPATKKHKVKNRIIFNGLRVRMGIHDASELDGVLVQDVHVVTGKTTYSGVSEIIAEYVGDLGSGGQILVTDRVASWLRHHRSEFSLDVFMEYVGNYTVPQIHAPVEIYELQPAMLAARASLFLTPAKAPQLLPRSRTMHSGSSRFQLARGGSTARMTFVGSEPAADDAPVPILEPSSPALSTSRRIVAPI